MISDGRHNYQITRGVASGEIAVEDARKSLEDASLTEEQMEMAIDKGVFTVADMGSVVSAKLAPSGASYLTMFFFIWGIFWACYWVFSLIYGLCQRLEPKATFIPFGHDRHHTDFDGISLFEIYSSRYNHCKTCNQQIYS